MTQILEARKGNITPEMEAVARAEGVSVDHVLTGVANGTIVITRNKRHTSITPLGIGKGLRTKVNANIGTSKDRMSIDDEIEKLKVAVAAGADAVMDLSTGGPIVEIRKEILKQSTVAIGTVPIYQAAVETVAQGKSIVQMDPELLFRVIEEQAEEGVDFVTVHCGVTISSVERLKRQGRIMDVVSRGGAFHLEWIIVNEAENPLYTQYDRLIEICEEVRHDPFARRRHAAGLSCRCHGPGADRGADHARRTARPGARSRRAGDDRGAGPCADQPGRDEHQDPEGALQGRAVLRARAARDRRCAGIRPHHLGHRRRDRRRGRRGLSLLRHAVRTSAPAGPRGCARGRDRIAHRGPRRRHRQGRQGRDGLGQGDGATPQGARLEGPDRAFDQSRTGAQAARVKPAERIRRLHHVRRVLLHEGREQVSEERSRGQKQRSGARHSEKKNFTLAPCGRWQG